MSKRHTHTCPIAAMLNIFGDNWTWLVMREAFYGATRFGEIQKNTGISKNMLSDRLARLVDEGLLETVNIGTLGERHAYQLTEKGLSLRPVMHAMSLWGNTHLYGDENAPGTLHDAVTGDQITGFSLHTASGRIVALDDIVIRPGPGASEATVRRLAKTNL